MMLAGLALLFFAILYIVISPRIRKHSNTEKIIAAFEKGISGETDGVSGGCYGGCLVKGDNFGI